MINNKEAHCEAFTSILYLLGTKVEYLLSTVEGEVFTASNFTPPDDMVFGEAQVISIITYAILFVFGLTFNTISLYQLISDRVKIKVRSKMNLLLIHLAIADLVVSGNFEWTENMFDVSPNYLI